MSFSTGRISRIRDAMRARGTKAMYIRETANIEWATGFKNVFDDEQAHAMLVADDAEAQALVHTDSRYVTAMEREATGSGIAIDAEAIGMSEWAHKHMSRAYEHLAIEDSISLAEYRRLEQAFGAQSAQDAQSKSFFTETHDLIVSLRAIKDRDEIRLLRAAQSVTDAAFAHIRDFIKPGMTEREVQLELDGYMLRHGASGLAFPTIIASGSNGASPHAIVSDKPLEAGECVVMDFGARKAGYCSDMTRTVFIGEPDGRMLTAWQTLREANEHVERMLRPGITGKEAHEAALAVLEAGGFGGRMGHGLGHGVGIQIHELPVLSPRNERPLVAGNVVTVEPGIYIPGQFGMRLEDFGVITEDGFDVFTQSTHELVVL